MLSQTLSIIFTEGNVPKTISRWNEMAWAAIMRICLVVKWDTEKQPLSLFWLRTRYNWTEFWNRLSGL